VGCDGLVEPLGIGNLNALLPRSLTACAPPLPSTHLRTLHSRWSAQAQRTSPASPRTGRAAEVGRDTTLAHPPRQPAPAAVVGTGV